MGESCFRNFTIRMSAFATPVAESASKPMRREAVTAHSTKKGFEHHYRLRDAFSIGVMFHPREYKIRIEFAHPLHN